MIRVFDFKVDSTEDVLSIASMSFSMAQKFVEQSRILLDRKDVKPEEWNRREHETVLQALNGVPGITEKWTLKRIAEEFDIPTLNAIYLFILEKSGLRPEGAPKVGEAKAASVSPISGAA